MGSAAAVFSRGLSAWFRFDARVSNRVAAAFAPVVRHRAEILTAIAMLGGWALVTWGVVLFTTWKVWPLSAGLLLLSCGGWRMLWAIASIGLYGLTRERDG